MTAQRSQMIRWLPLLALLPAIALPESVCAQASVSGSVVNRSLWRNVPPPGPPPGDGAGDGSLIVGVWGAGGTVIGAPLASVVAASTLNLPFPWNASYPYLITPLVNGDYKVAAWIDADHNTAYDIGEPLSDIVSLSITSAVAGINMAVDDDSDNDGLPDWWEVHYFGDLTPAAGEDADNDGLSNEEEYQISIANPPLAGLNPTQFDTDFDGMDDYWEYRYYAFNQGLNATTNDAMGDADGDGLLNIQEYNGMDGAPRMEQDPSKAPGVGRLSGSADDLNPIDLDTDGDALVDSFEAAWFNSTNNINPLVKTDHAADPDEDGLTTYREQCLLFEFRQGQSNDIWGAGPGSLPPTNTFGVRGFSPPLLLGAVSTTIQADRSRFTTNEWTDPSCADSDLDSMPDGWEVEFNLDPRSGDTLIWNGSAWVINPDANWGDPDSDTLLNLEEYTGQDGDRALNSEYINGTGDETNPNEHNWRPDSTTNGLGVCRPLFTNWWFSGHVGGGGGTLGAALPTASLGVDGGADTDDDGLPDALEIQQEYAAGTNGTSPVHSMSPFMRRAALVTSTNGMLLPDPEGTNGFGYRGDLYGHRDWTLECHVYLTATGRTGSLIFVPSLPGLSGVDYACRLHLSNDVPQVAFRTPGGFVYQVGGAALPTSRWVHVAGVWDHNANSLALYVDGVFVQESRVYQEALIGSIWSVAGATNPAIGRSSAGPASFTNSVYIDEVRIWKSARTADEIEQYRRRLVSPSHTNLLAYFRFDDGGATAEDFARKAKNGLRGAADENYTFGDHGYALAGGFSLSTNAAEVLGASERGADDADGDGLPDDWEMINHLDPLSTNNWLGARADPDADGLVNIYEFWAQTNPWDDDSDQDAVLDDQEDLDGDGMPNLTDQILDSRPDMVDTDDDGLADNIERAGGTNPTDPLSPSVSRCMEFGGTPQDYVEIPTAFKQRLRDWTLEAWVNPTNAVDGQGSVVRRSVQSVGGGRSALNYALGLTNDGGVLHAYAGFVTPSGAEYFVRTPFPIPTGAWTHLAATYNSSNNPPTLTIFTNGTFCASTNGMFPLPPLNGKGGEAFVRIGEDFGGKIDEVRIWARVRNATEILETYDIGLTGSNTGLIHSFRFDDGQAVTNYFPFGAYHQPHGPQDFVYPQDWNDQWMHAGIMRGNVRFADAGALLAPPSLMVILEPEAARIAGACWALDGGAWRSSGEIAGNLDPDNLVHAISYSTVPGWTAPSNEIVYVTNGVLLTLVRYYTQDGGLTVILEPGDARTDGAQWQVDGGAWKNSGESENNLSPGGHTVSYKPLSGWSEPPSETVTISAGSGTNLTRWYIRPTGTITIYIEPPEAILDRAHWRLDGAGPWMDSGQPATNVSLGLHVVSFLDLLAWYEPTNLYFTITNVVSVADTGTYTRITGIYCFLEPPEAVATGAQWRIDGGTWTNSGVLVVTPPGTYLIDFKPIAGWAEPSPVYAIVEEDTLVQFTRTYFRYDVFGGPGSELGQFNKPRGMAMDRLRRLYVADSENHRVQILDPTSGAWSAIGSYGTATGQFNQPFSVALDTNHNLYVADCNNNRVQRRDASNGAWTVWGGPAIGSGQGQFNGPFDLTVDSTGILYVADHYNSRVQRRSPAGLWTTFLTNSFATNGVRTPRGLCVDDLDNVYVVDYDATISNGFTRVRKFRNTGQYLALLGTSDSDKGSLKRSRGIKVDSSTNVFLADTENNRVATNGSASLSWDTLVGAPTLNLPEGIALDPAGYLFVSDTGNNRVLRIQLPSWTTVYPRATVRVLPSGQPSFTIEWVGRHSRFYAIQYMDRLAPNGTWRDLPGGKDLAGNDGTMSCTDTNITGVSTRAYRILVY